MDQIFKKVSEIIQDLLGLQPGDITLESTLEEDIGADSLDRLEIIMLIEEKFDIEIPDEEELKTVQDICTYLDTNTGG